MDLKKTTDASHPATALPATRFVGLLLAFSVLFQWMPYALNAFFGNSLHPETTTHPWNFSPAIPISIFVGAWCSKPWLALIGPLLARLILDTSIGMTTGRWEWAFDASQWGVYIAIALCAALGFVLRDPLLQLRRQRPIPTMAFGFGAGFAGACLFFLITNFSWWTSPLSSHPHTLEGLMQCYAAAIPFVIKDLLSFVVFTPILFSPLCLTFPIASPRMPEKLEPAPVRISTR